MFIELTDEQAVNLYQFLESDDCPNWWETPLAPLHEPVKSYFKYESEL